MITVGIDARDGFVQVKGWVETTGTLAIDLAKRVEAAGVKTIIYTDTATDGMLGGPNVEAMRKMCEAVPRCRIIASGGVSAPEHVAALSALGCANLTARLSARHCTTARRRFRRCRPPRGRAGRERTVRRRQGANKD